MEVEANNGSGGNGLILFSALMKPASITDPYNLKGSAPHRHTCVSFLFFVGAIQ